MAEARARLHAACALDLSGIAKGYGVDVLAHCLRALGITNFLVGIDGEMRAGGGKPDGRPWTVGIERPVWGARDVLEPVVLAERAIATSGDYRNRISVGDVHLSHTMDPRNARPLQNGVASVSVLAADCMSADAWATALMVLGGAEGPVMASAHGLDALFVLRNGQKLHRIPVGLFERSVVDTAGNAGGPHPNEKMETGK